MAKHDWNDLRAEFASSNLSVKEFAESKGINYNTARRYLKTSDQGSDHKSDHRSDQKGDHKRKPAQIKAKPEQNDHCAQPSEETKRHGRDHSGRFSKGNEGNKSRPVNAFEPGNDAAVKHSGYSRRLNDDEAFQDARSARLNDEIDLCRARAMLCMDVHARIKNDLATNADSVEKRIALYDKLINVEQAMDRNIARVESLSLTVSRIRKLELESERLASESAGLGTEIGEIVAEIQAMGTDGLMSGPADE